LLLRLLDKKLELKLLPRLKQKAQSKVKKVNLSHPKWNQRMKLTKSLSSFRKKRRKTLRKQCRTNP
jgi:hypothetical protein